MTLSWSGNFSREAGNSLHLRGSAWHETGLSGGSVGQVSENWLGEGASDTLRLPRDSV